MSAEPNMPPLCGRGADAHEIRRAVELSFRTLDAARLRARRSDFGYIDAELTTLLRTLEQVRKAAEKLRRDNTPPEFRRVGDQSQAVYDAAHPEGVA